MKNDLEKFVSLFSISQQSVVEETLQELKIVFKTADLVTPANNDDFKNIVFLNKRDTLKISVIIGYDDPIDYYSSNNSQDFFSELENRLQIRDDEEIEVTFLVTKNKIEDIISAYFPSELTRYLNALDLKGILYVLNNAFESNGPILLESQFEEINFETDLIVIKKQHVETLKLRDNNREKKLAQAKTTCHFNLSNNYSFIPSDFFVRQSTNQLFTNLFDKLCVIYSAAFLYDITSIDNDNFYYKLNGYKSINGDCNFNDIKSNQAYEYYKIFEWCYTGGNFNDKIGLARNIISLHLKNKNNISLKGHAFESLQSSFKVYEKQNISQYIDIRNKVSEQLLTFHERAEKIVEGFANGFQKNALALISFYISSIAIKALSNSTSNTGIFISSFSIDTTIFSFVFLACSLIYLKYSIWELNEQKKRFSKSYLNLKTRYTDLLDPEDIHRILNKDAEFDADLAFIDDKRNKYRTMWIVFLSILFLATLILFVINLKETPLPKK